MDMMVVGLTGNIAMGKSTVSKTFLKHNIPVVDADIIARQVVEPGTIGLAQLSNLFGKEYLNNDNTLNRQALGHLVFSNDEALRQLNAVMCPLIQNESANQIKHFDVKGYKIILYDAPLLIEQNNQDKYRPLIVVHCDKETQIQRLMSRNNLSREDALKRINAQLTIEEKIKVADYTINTNSSIDYSIQQTEDIIKELKDKLC